MRGCYRINRMQVVLAAPGAYLAFRGRESTRDAVGDGGGQETPSVWIAGARRIPDGTSTPPWLLARVDAVSPARC